MYFMVLNLKINYLISFTVSFLFISCICRFSSQVFFSLFLLQSPKSIFHHPLNADDFLSALPDFPEVPPSSPDSEPDDIIYLSTLKKHKSESLKTCGRSLSVNSGRRLYRHCYTVKSASLVKNGYNTD